MKKSCCAGCGQNRRRRLCTYISVGLSDDDGGGGGGDGDDGGGGRLCKDIT